MSPDTAWENIPRTWPRERSSFADAVRTVRNRGKYMQEAVPVGVGAMAAILGMDLEKVTAVCADAAQGEVCEPANINSPEQIVISGHTAAVERATKLASERGAKRAVMLSGQRALPLFADEAGAGPAGGGFTIAAISEAGSSGRVQCRCALLEDAEPAAMPWSGR